MKQVEVFLDWKAFCNLTIVENNHKGQYQYISVLKVFKMYIF